MNPKPIPNVVDLEMAEQLIVGLMEQKMVYKAVDNGAEKVAFKVISFQFKPIHGDNYTLFAKLRREGAVEGVEHGLFTVDASEIKDHKYFEHLISRPYYLENTIGVTPALKQALGIPG